jgi:hypothetical protein
MLENLVIPDEENPLLRRLPSGQFTFASDPDREVSAARYFGKEIISGRLPVNDAVTNYWPKPLSQFDIFFFELLSPILRSEFIEAIRMSIKQLIEQWDYSRIQDRLLYLRSLYTSCSRLIGLEEADKRIAVIDGVKHALEVYSRLCYTSSREDYLRGAEAAMCCCREEEVQELQRASVAFTSAQLNRERTLQMEIIKSL